MIAKDNNQVSESGHWYHRATGKPMYQIVGKNGKVRNTNLKDAKASGELVPSVTTIIKCSSSPGLEAWKLGQMLMASLTLPRIDGESLDDFAVRIQHDSKQTGIKAAERGTAIHAGIQAYYEGDLLEGYLAHAKATESALNAHFGTNEWLPEVSFAKGGFGGKCDLMVKGNPQFNGIVVDIKTKEFTDPAKIVAYDEHLMQLAAYRWGLSIPSARCANAFVSVQEPVQVKIVEWSEVDLARGWAMFQNLLSFWQLKNNYK